MDSARPEVLLAFDRDLTVDTSGGAVPLALVRALAKRYPCWALGNQLLTDEAGIPGIDELAARTGYGDLDALWGRAQPHSVLSSKQRNVAAKIVRLGLLDRVYPAAVRKIVVDDFEVIMTGWTYLTPEQAAAELPGLLK